MHLFSPRRLHIPAFAFFMAAQALGADPAAELAAFSAFPKVDLAELGKGKILTARSPTMPNLRHLSVQSAYVIRQAAPKTAELLRNWEGTRHSQLKIYLHGALPAKPSPADFAKLNDAPAAFFKATQTLDLNKTQMSQAEAAKLAQFGREGKPAAVAFWSDLLAGRAAAFATGGLARQPPFEGREPVRAGAEVAALLAAQPKIRDQFASLPAGGVGSGYWNLFDVEGQPHVSLGTVSLRPAGEGTRMLDLRYYASGGVYTQLTYHQLWPVDLGGEPATLVWRGDLISSGELASLRGVERTGSGVAMMREVEKTVAAFRKDAGSSR